MFCNLIQRSEQGEKSGEGGRSSAWSLGHLQGGSPLTPPSLSPSPKQCAPRFTLITHFFCNPLQHGGVGSGEKENRRTAHTRESGRFIRSRLFRVPQVLTFQVKKELRKGHIMHKEFSLPYCTLVYLEGRPGILKKNKQNTHSLS